MKKIVVIGSGGAGKSSTCRGTFVCIAFLIKKLHEYEKRANVVILRSPGEARRYLNEGRSSRCQVKG